MAGLLHSTCSRSRNIVVLGVEVGVVLPEYVIVGAVFAVVC